MSIGPLGGILGSAAGTPLSQTKGAAAERAGRDAAAQERGVELDLKAEKAAGIGQTEGDQQSSDRDADGRRLWEHPPQGKHKEQPSPDQEESENAASAEGDRISSGDDEEPGSTLDLVG
ncbi:hypothetical protein [Botrimarina hoheduenensis]|uniref:Uncharacterized protein n=1 Tax=Botrimarina hoheduenensis TaxID=2528000 RepID=A0A5C5VVG9_9BACT|nr:hypothetical protein [Botrimarina hoheduenensis]TWT41591.1 hypothetical protein Pla111_29680 [Botrimarina hoheduenensis]